MFSELHPRVQIVASSSEFPKLIPKLSKLSATTEMKAYGAEEWKYLLHAGSVTSLVLSPSSSLSSTDDDLLGCILRIDCGKGAAAFGMTLVSKEA